MGGHGAIRTTSEEGQTVPRILVRLVVLVGVTAWLSGSFGIDGFRNALFAAVLIAASSVVLEWFVPEPT